MADKESKSHFLYSELHKGKKEVDVKVGSGFETGERGVRRKVYRTKEGLAYYVDKKISSEKEAKRVMQIYQKMREAGLPIAQNAKIIRKKEDGKIVFYIAMEDLTQGGNLDITELVSSEKLRQHNLIEHLEEPLKFKESIIRALAIMHNNEIFNFHPTISFVLLTSRHYLKPKLREKYKGHTRLSFKIIDYSNFAYKELPPGWESIDVKAGVAAKEMEHDLNKMSLCLGKNQDEMTHLVNTYWEIRESGDKKF